MANQETTISVSGTLPVTYRNALFRILTTDDGEAQFEEIMLRQDQGEFQMIASLMESSPDYFIAVLRNEYGSRRVPKLFGLSPVVDDLFCCAILNRFFHIMTDRYASYVAVRAIRVFDPDQQRILHEFTIYKLLDIARNRYGSVAVNEIITYSDCHVGKSQIMEKITFNALMLSNDVYGSLVVQKALELNTLRATRVTLVSLRGNFVNLSMSKQGSDVVNQLMECTQEALIAVVDEFIGCTDDRLLNLANDEFGTNVVRKALRVTGELVSSLNLFSPLVHKLKSLRELLRESPHGNVIGNFLDATTVVPNYSRHLQTSLGSTNDS